MNKLLRILFVLLVAFLVAKRPRPTRPRTGTADDPRQIPKGIQT